MTAEINTTTKGNLGIPAQKMSEHAVVIEPTRGWAALHLDHLWRFRELLYFMIWRDLKVRYRQTVLGASWAIIQPLFTTVLFTFIFDRAAGLPSEGFPYPIFSFTALLAWNYFSNAFSQSGNSLVNNQQLISKVYFPRLIIPISSALVGLVDFAIAFVILVVMMFVYRIYPTWNLLVLPFFLVLAVITALGVGLWLSAMNVQYRDIRYLIPFMAQFWMYATPVAWSIEMFDARWHWLFGLNPMAGVVEGFRWAVLGKADISWVLILLSVLVAAILFFTGMIYFRRMERSFADII
jgi:lipopolysaccharide transport system permease protein